MSLAPVRARLSGTAPLPQNLGVADIWSPGAAEDSLRSTKGELRTYAQRLLTSEMTLGYDKKMALGKFFDSSLSQDPEHREMKCLQEFLRKLGLQGYGGPLLDLAHINFLNPTIIDLIINFAEVSSKVHLT
jgi:hypothetical protein